MNDQPKTSNTMNDQPKTSNTKIRRRHISMWLVLLALSVMLTFSSRLSNRIIGKLREGARATWKSLLTSERSDYSAEIRRYNEAVADALERHLTRLDEIAASFDKDLLKKGPGRFDPARAAIPDIRKSFSSFSAMSGVVKDGALDKALGGDRLQERFNAALDGPFVRPCARAGESLVADYETFSAQMAAESEAFREEVAGAYELLPQAVSSEFPAEALRAGMERTYGALNGLPLKAGLVAMETTIEVATIRATVTSARNLALRYGAKAIGKGTVTAAAPAADGPLPIGDALAVGFALWTAYDIYDLMDVLPREIEKSLTQTVDAFQAQTLDAVSEAARQTLEAHVEAARSLAGAACVNQSARQIVMR